MLKKGLKEIAKNHGLNYSIDEYGMPYVWGGMNIPTMSDVQMLMEDVKMPRENAYFSEFGVDFESYGWEHDRRYVKGFELWRNAS
jgi:hypothetical protein